MSAIGERRAEVVAALRVGSRWTVTADPAASAPMILVDMFTGTRAEGVGGWAGVIAVRCVMPPPGDAACVAVLEDMAEHVMTVLRPPPVITPGTYRISAGEDGRPMVSIDVPTVIPAPYC